MVVTQMLNTSMFTVLAFLESLIFRSVQFDIVRSILVLLGWFQSLTIEVIGVIWVLGTFLVFQVILVFEAVSVISAISVVWALLVGEAFIFFKEIMA